MGAHNQNLTVLAKWIKPSLRCFMFQITKTGKSDICQIYLDYEQLECKDTRIKIKEIFAICSLFMKICFLEIFLL